MDLKRICQLNHCCCWGKVLSNQPTDESGSDIACLCLVFVFNEDINEMPLLDIHSSVDHDCK